MNHLTVFSAFFLLLFSACTSDETAEPLPNCEQKVVLDQELFQTAPSDRVAIISAIIGEECLEIEFSASGCDGGTWTVSLIDSEAIAESIPMQRSLRLSLENLELCQAVITQEISFDISSLQVEGHDELILNLKDWADPIRYEY